MKFSLDDDDDDVGCKISKVSNFKKNIFQNASDFFQIDLQIKVVKNRIVFFHRFFPDSGV